MSGYPSVDLASLAEIQSGFAFASKDYTERGHFLMRIGNVQEGRISLEKPKFVELSKKTEKYALNEGDFLTSLTGYIGRVARMEAGHLPAALNQRVARLRVKVGKALPEYIGYFLQTDAFRLPLEEKSHGAAQANVSPKEISKIPVPLPPMDEQKRIVAVLDQAFAALDGARANAEANLADAEELFDSWLTAVFHEHPSSWKVEKLSQLCHRITVGHVGPMAKRYSTSGTPFLRSQNVRAFYVDLAEVKFIDDKFRSELKKSELKPGDVAIVRTGYPGTAAVIPDDLPLANCADLVIARPKPELVPEFLAMFLNSSFGKKMVAEKAVGAAQKHFNVGAAKNVDFAYPGLEIQRALVSDATKMREYASGLARQFETKLDEIDHLRRTILSKVFAGNLN